MARPNTAAARLLAGEREPVRVATTANITLSGLQTIDGVLLIAGDRVLVKNQTTASQNGIYEASSGTWYRAGDARVGRALNKGVTVHVQSGTVNSGKIYVFATLNPVVGTTSITVTEYLSGTFVADMQAIAAAAAASAALAADITTSGAYTPAGTGAILRSVQSRLRDRATVFDFIPTAEHAAITAQTSTYDVSTNLQSAITAVGGKAPLWVNNGKYIVTVGQRFITTSSDTFAPGLELIGDGGGSTIFDNRVGVTNRSDDFATETGSVHVTVTRTAHGKLYGEQFEIYGASTGIGGLTFNGTWFVSEVPDANTFKFRHTSTASSTTNGTVGYGEVNPLFDLDTNTELKFQQYAKLANFKIINTTSPTASTAIRMRRVYHVDFERLWIIGMTKDGIKITVPNPFAGDSDGGNQVTVRHCRLENNLGWGLDCAMRPGNNELSYLGVHDTIFSGNGTATANYPPPTGGMRWKGQVLRGSNVGFVINQNVALLVEGGAGLSNTLSMDALTVENTVKRGVVITGLRQGEFSNLQLYNNDGFVATVGMEIDGASSVCDNIRVSGAVVRATSGNNPYTAFKLTGANANAKTCRIDFRDVAWDNFDYAGQTRWGGWSIDHTNFSANKNAVDQTGIVSATWTKVTFGTESWDDGGFYDTTNSRWTPSPGKGRLLASVFVTAGMVDQAQSILAIYKNGTILKNISTVNSSGTTSFGMIGDCLETFTGTDYYEVWFNGGGAGNKTISGAVGTTYFQGTML